VTEEKIIEQVTGYNYLGNRILEQEKDMKYKLISYNLTSGIK
jgi:hypothetical protein